MFVCVFVCVCLCVCVFVCVSFVVGVCVECRITVDVSAFVRLVWVDCWVGLVVLVGWSELVGLLFLLISHVGLGQMS